MRTSHLKADVPTQMKPLMPVALDDFWPHDKVLLIQLSLLSIFYLEQKSFKSCFIFLPSQANLRSQNLTGLWLKSSFLNKIKSSHKIAQVHNLLMI